MRQHELIAEYYQHHIEIGELEPEYVPPPSEIAAEWEVSRRTAQGARSLLVESGLCKPLVSRKRPLGAITHEYMTSRFFPRVLSRDAHGCQLWDGPEAGGYGQTNLHGRHVYAHLVAYEYHHGPIPNGLFLDHVWVRGCRSTLCVNVAHLEPVTHEENVRRGFAASRWRASIQVRTELDDD
jgi:hypothetical protein